LYIGDPAVIHRGVIREVLEIGLNEKEKQQFNRPVSVLKNTMKL